MVLDTNVLVRSYVRAREKSASVRVFKLWRERRLLQLIVSDELQVEYLEILQRLNVSSQRIDGLVRRLRERVTVTHVNLGPRFTSSRDPDDNILLATAAAGKAKYLITNDRDLLEIPDSSRRRFRFEIVTPQDFLAVYPS